MNKNPEETLLILKPFKGSFLLDDVQGELTKEKCKTLQEQDLVNFEKEVLSLIKNPEIPQAFRTAKEVILRFDTVPWHIWMFAKEVTVNDQAVESIDKIILASMRRLVFAIASEKTFGSKGKVDNLQDALRSLSADVLVACSFIHSVSRSLSSCDHERIWMPILEESLLRAKIGYQVAKAAGIKSCGSAMLLTFICRIGVAILVSQGKYEEAESYLAATAAGKAFEEVGFDIYNSNPLLISALCLIASGIKKDLAIITLYFTDTNPLDLFQDAQQNNLAMLNFITENLRTENLDKISTDHWKSINLDNPEKQSKLIESIQESIRNGHGMNWII